MSKVIEMERKVTKFGNSLGITMTEALKQIGLELGDIVHINVKETVYWNQLFFVQVHPPSVMMPTHPYSKRPLLYLSP